MQLQSQMLLSGLVEKGQCLEIPGQPGIPWVVLGLSVEVKSWELPGTPGGPWTGLEVGGRGGTP